jgi:PPOX class probable F420-dependent enzyme
MDPFYRLLEVGRHPDAAEIARQPPGASDFSEWEGIRQALLVSFKGNGEGVSTPVNCALTEDGKLYFRSEPHTAKMKRMARTPRVLVGPCNVRGKPRGSLAEGRARILPAEESRPAYEAIRANWSPMVWPSEMAMDRVGVEVAYVEVVSTGSDERAPVVVDDA